MVETVMYARFGTKEQITGAIPIERSVSPETEVSHVHPPVNRTNVSLIHHSFYADQVLNEKVHP